MIRDSSGHRGRNPQTAVHTAKVIVRDVHGNRRREVFQFLRETQRQPCEPLDERADRQIVPLDVAGTAGIRSRSTNLNGRGSPRFSSILRPPGGLCLRSSRRVFASPADPTAATVSATDPNSTIVIAGSNQQRDSVTNNVICDALPDGHYLSGHGGPLLDEAPQWPLPLLGGP